MFSLFDLSWKLGKMVPISAYEIRSSSSSFLFLSLSSFLTSGSSRLNIKSTIEAYLSDFSNVCEWRLHYPSSLTFSAPFYFLLGDFDFPAAFFLFVGEELSDFYNLAFILLLLFPNDLLKSTFFALFPMDLLKSRFVPCLIKLILLLNLPCGLSYYFF